MKRRSFIASVGVLTASILGVPRISFSQGTTLKTVLRGGRCFYQDRWQTMDVGIDISGRMVVAATGTLEGKEILDIGNKIISPGFIDILGDNTANPIQTYSIFEKYKVSDGVTTALQMHGGSGETASYYKTFGAKPHFINYGVSTAVMRVRYATTDFADRKRKVEQCLGEGALGVSHSIEYQPTPYEEVLAYARLAKKYERPLFLHLRYSSESQELYGVDEAVRLAKESGARVHIDHLHSTGGTFHMEDALTKIRTANNDGLEITCCVYPYSYWATYLHSTRFDEGWQQRYGLTYHDLQLVGTGEHLTKESFAKYRALKKLVAVPEGTMPLGKSVDLALKEDFCMIGSDGGIESAQRANNHPRGAGCFATSLRHGINIGIPIEKMLSKMTTMPVQLMRPILNDRASIRTGAIADLTVFNRDTIDGSATVANPNQFSKGIELVFVNGGLAYEKGTIHNHHGTSIRYSNS